MTHHPGERHLERLFADERIEVRAVAGDAVIVVTPRRVGIADEHRLLTDAPIDQLRRIEFDIELTRPATLVIVPGSVAYEPQVIAVPPQRYREVADALAYVGQRIAELHPVQVG